MKKVYIIPQAEEMTMEPMNIIMTSIPDPFAPAPRPRTPQGGDIIP